MSSSARGRYEPFSAWGEVVAQNAQQTQARLFFAPLAMQGACRLQVEHIRQEQGTVREVGSHRQSVELYQGRDKSTFPAQVSSERSWRLSVLVPA